MVVMSKSMDGGARFGACKATTLGVFVKYLNERTSCGSIQ
jgi:hypothetical protein